MHKNWQIYVACCLFFTDGRRKRSLIDDESDSAAGPFSSILGGSPSKLMRYHDALLYRRRLADYYANCPPTFPLLTPQLRRLIQAYDPKLFQPVRPGSPTAGDGNAAASVPSTARVSGSRAANQSAGSILSSGGDHAGTEQTVSPPSLPLLGALFSYMHPSLAAAAAAAMTHWYLGAGAGGGAASSRLPPTNHEALLAQRGGTGSVPDWAVRLRVEDLLRARSAAAAGQTSSSVTSGQYTSLDEGSWIRHGTTSVTDGVQSSQQPQPTASPDTSATDVPFRPYLPDIRRPTDQRPSPDDESASHWDRSDVVSSGSKTPDQEAESGDSGETADERNSSELVNIERMVHGLKHVQTAAIEELSKVADSY